MGAFRTFQDKPAIRTGDQGDTAPLMTFATNHTLPNANVSTTFQIPPGARGFRISAATNPIRYCVDAVNVPLVNAPTTTSGVLVVTYQYGRWNQVPTATTEKRYFDAEVTPTVLQVMAAVSATTLTVEFF